MMKLKKQIQTLLISISFGTALFSQPAFAAGRDYGQQSSSGGNTMVVNSRKFYLDYYKGVYSYTPQVYNSPDSDKIRFVNELASKAGASGEGSNSAGRQNKSNHIKQTAQITRFTALKGNNITQAIGKRIGLGKGGQMPGNFKLNNAKATTLMSCRFLGLGMSDKRAVIMTNDSFVQDTLTEGSKPATAQMKTDPDRSIIGFKYNGDMRDSAPLNFLNLAARSAAFPSTEQSQYDTNPEMVKEAFRLFAERTLDGQEYKAMMINQFGLSENNWQNGVPNQAIINQQKDANSQVDVRGKSLSSMIRIDGNPFKLDDHGTLTLTMKHYQNKKRYYRTYTIPSKPRANTYPNILILSDNTNKIYDYSYQNGSTVNNTDPVFSRLDNGALAHENVGTGLADGTGVHIKVNEQYTITAAIESLNAMGKTSTDVSKRDVFLAIANADKQFVRMISQPASSESTPSFGNKNEALIANNNATDISLGSNAVKTTRTIDADFGQETSTVNYGTACYIDQTFSLSQTDPFTGYIAIALNDSWRSDGCTDNDIQNDDILFLKYTLSNEDKPQIQNVSYGDMNLGKQELRRLHWMDERPAKEDPDESDSGSSGPTGGPSTPGGESGEEEEKEPVYVHMKSSQGLWSSVDEAKANADTDVESAPEQSDSDVPPLDDADSSGSYQSTGESNTFQEYARVYDPSETDADKIWLEGDAGERQYIRSELDNVPFKVKTIISSSRGNKDGITSPTVSQRIYGISPDTDEKGVLLGKFNTTTDQTLDGGASVFQGTGGNLDVYSTTEATSDEKVIDSNASTADIGDHDLYQPQIRVVADVSEDVHGESGFTGLDQRSPQQNALHSSDHAEYIFDAESDDMFISEVVVKDSEGIVVYHAYRSRAGQTLKQYVPADNETPIFDREEDYVLYVKIKQNYSASHAVKHPTIDVKVDPLYHDSTFTTSYINRVQEDGTTGAYSQEMDPTGVTATEYEFPFRASQIKGEKIRFDIKIDDIHGEDNWRENVWDESDDHTVFDLHCTTANMAMTQDIELYNSKNNQQNYITFAEYLRFKFDIQHRGNKDRAVEHVVVGGTAANPMPSLRQEVYNADALTTTQSGVTKKLKYDNSGTTFAGNQPNDVKQDPKASKALIQPRSSIKNAGNGNNAVEQKDNNLISATTRLFPGLGEYGYASHVQVWTQKYIAQSFMTSTGNIAAYGHIVVYGKIDDRHTYNLTNTIQGQEDLVQKEFIGEKNIKIESMSATARSAISTGAQEDTYEPDPAQQKKIYGTVNVQLAIENVATNYTDPTVIDKVYVTFWTRPKGVQNAEWKEYVSDDPQHRFPIKVEVPVGQVVLTDTTLEKIEIPKDGLEIRAGVNVGSYQTHYEYVYDSSRLNKDPFADNYQEFTVMPNLPDESACPDCITDPNAEAPASIDPVKESQENNPSMVDVTTNLNPQTVD